MNNTHPIEFVWLIVTTFGVLYSILNMFSARAEHKIDPTSWLGQIIYLSARLTVAVHVTIFGAAVAALFLAPPPPDYLDVWQSIVNVFAWIAVSAQLSFLQFLSRRWRRHLSSEEFKNGNGRTAPVQPDQRSNRRTDRR
jgi:hypothetical protein